MPQNGSLLLINYKSYISNLISKYDQRYSIPSIILWDNFTVRLNNYISVGFIKQRALLKVTMRIVNYQWQGFKRLCNIHKRLRRHMSCRLYAQSAAAALAATAYVRHSWS